LRRPRRNGERNTVPPCIELPEEFHFEHGAALSGNRHEIG
jgi:hypothetical protein